MNKVLFESDIFEALANAELAARLLLFMAGPVRADPIILEVSPEELSCLFDGFGVSENDFASATLNGVFKC